MMDILAKNQFFNLLVDNFKLMDDDLHEVRKKGLHQFKKLGLPKFRSEEYKYTNISKALDKVFGEQIIAAEPNISKEEIDSILPDDLNANLIIILNGKYSKNYSNIESVHGLSVMGFNEAKRSNGNILNNISSSFDKIFDPFVALNTASLNDGIVIKIESGIQINKPLHIAYVSDTKTNQSFQHPRALIIADNNSEFSLIESFYTLGEHPSFNNVVTEIILGKNTHCSYYKIGSENDNSYHVGTTQVTQNKDSTFTGTTINLNGAIIRNNLNIILNARNCEAYIYGLYLLKGKQHVDNHTIVDHRKPDCYSNELYKGILDENATGVFNGKIFVRPNAQKTNAFQSNKNILLTDTATINTKPQLEIWADDVKCSHGCTTGQLDQEQIFYLRSRGINYDSARAMVLHAFAMDILEKIKIEPLKNYLDRKISKRLHG